MTLPSGSQHRRELDLPGSADCTAEFVMAPNLSGTVRAVLISGPRIRILVSSSENFIILPAGHVSGRERRGLRSPTIACCPKFSEADLVSITVGTGPPQYGAADLSQGVFTVRCGGIFLGIGREGVGDRHCFVVGEPAQDRAH